MSSGRGPVLTMLLAMLMAAAWTAAGRAAEPSSVMIVLDGSGSMWGLIDGARQNKLTLVRDNMRRALGKLGPETRVGLVGFGQRRGDCNDVEVMLPAEKLDVERIMAPLGPYNPKGRGPLALALREAGKSLTGIAGRRSLVLIHDDADNCQADACAAATELKAAGVVVHVVGMSLKPPDLAKMACVPQITGGRMLNAATADLVGPMLEEAMRLAGGDAVSPEPPRSPVATQVSVQRPTAPLSIEGPPGLYMRALLAPKTEPVNWPVRWTVYKESEPGRLLYDTRSINPMLPLAAGRYVVEARDGQAAGTQTVNVGDAAPTLAAVPLNAGALLVKAIAQRTGTPLGDALISISEAGQGPDGKPVLGAPVAVFKGGEGLATLTAGRYVVRVEQGLVRAERFVVVPAGSQGRIEVPLNGARVVLTAVAREGAGPLELPVFSVSEDDPDAPKGRREVARSAARQAEFTLPPGTYYVVARLAGVESRELLALAPGDTVRRTLTLASGRLTLSTRLTGGVAPSASDTVSYRVERLDGPDRDVVTTSRPTPTLQLAAGRYRVEGRYGGVNARVVREVEVRPGQVQQLPLEHQPVVLKLRLTGAGTALGDVFWDIRDESGRNVWTTGQSEPSVILQAGRYVVRAETRDKRYDRQVDLRAGETRQLELTAD
ncbi:MAG TPA: vWA domain-containing protein [Hyphomicrobiaceae bacterium]|nr:vWA domain-containing protein [Hyphomicrobiaceae bacterium]